MATNPITQQASNEKLPATRLIIERTPLGVQEWARVNETEPWVTTQTADKVRALCNELASYLDITPDQALLIVVEDLCQRSLVG